jgi:hypothetical protein
MSVHSSKLPLRGMPSSSHWRLETEILSASRLDEHGVYRLSHGRGICPGVSFRIGAAPRKILKKTMAAVKHAEKGRS